MPFSTVHSIYIPKTLVEGMNRGVVLYCLKWASFSFRGGLVIVYQGVEAKLVQGFRRVGHMEDKPMAPTIVFHFFHCKWVFFLLISLHLQLLVFNFIDSCRFVIKVLYYWQPIWNHSWDLPTQHKGAQLFLPHWQELSFPWEALILTYFPFAEDFAKKRPLRLTSQL